MARLTKYDEMFTRGDGAFTRCVWIQEREGAEPLRGTFLGLIHDPSGQGRVMAVVHLDGEPLLDTVDTQELTLERDRPEPE